MSQAKDDEPPIVNKENELFPPNCSIPELKSAFATFNYGQEKCFDKMRLMESHASLFHVICSVIKSCKKSAEHDKIQKHRQICQGVPRNDNVIEKGSISTKNTQGTLVLIEDRQEDKKVGSICVGQVVPVLAKDGQVVPGLPEDGQDIPILDEYGEMVPVLTEDGLLVPDFVKDEQVIPVLAEDGQEVPILAEDEQVIPVLAEDGQEAPILDEDEQVIPVLTEEDGQEVPILDEDEQVIPVLAEEDGQEVPVLDEDGQVPDLAEEYGQEVPILDEDGQVPDLDKDGQVIQVLGENGLVVPVLAGYGQMNHVLSEEEQVIPVSDEDGQVDHILAEDGQVGPVLFKDGQGPPVIVEYKQESFVYKPYYKQESFVLVKEGKEGSVLAKRNQEDPTVVKEDSVLARVTHKNKGLCKSMHSKLQLASQRKSVIGRRQLIPSHEQLSPAQMIPYEILINRSIPLPISVIHGLCREKKIMCTVQCFKQRCKKKTLLLQPASAKQPIPKVQTDPDYVTFDSLKNLQWKLYKGIVKRKPKTAVTQKISIFSVDKLQPPCPKASVYILPLLPKNWIIDESLK